MCPCMRYETAAKTHELLLIKGNINIGSFNAGTKDFSSLQNNNLDSEYLRFGRAPQVSKAQTICNFGTYFGREGQGAQAEENSRQFCCEEYRKEI